MNIWNRFNEQYLLVVGSIILSVALLISGCTGGESRSFPPSGSEASGESTSDYVRTIGQEDAQLPISFNLEDRDLETYKGLPVGFTEQGYPFRGDPNAPITLVEYSDYLCPFCGRHFNQTLPALIESYGETGQVNFVFRDFPLASLHPTAPLGHAAALCVAEQGPALYWEMHDTLFANQGQWNQPGDPSGYLNGLADSIGVDMDAYNDCVAAGNTSALVNQSVSEIQGLGFGGTPSFQVMDGQTGQIYLLVGAQPLQVFANMLDTLLAGEQPPDAQTQAAEASQVTFDVDDEMATYQGLPAGFTEEGYPFLGNPEATISLVEFSDYLCPFCGRHFNQTYPALIQSYGASGEVNFVFRDLPLASLHPTAHYGHEAALCAGEQGAELFWAMHDQLFATQNQWANLPDPTGFVAGLAEGIGVDMKAYDSCIANGQTRAQIEERVAEGRALGFTGTPTFQVLVNDTGDVHEVTGAQPLQIFSDMLDALIAGEDIPESDEPDQG
ncbi:MAG: DsbA family protein, partial [Anaerolineaceae bacterium]